jgi:predicted nucleotidyltransferase
LDRVLQARAERNERERLDVRARLRAALGEFLPAGSRVWLYGSLVKPGGFSQTSDVDVALEHEPKDQSIYLLMSRLSERTGREIDLALLGETRLREMILREGEPWTL